MNSEDVLDAMQNLILRDGQAPSIQTLARSLGKSKQAVLHYFPGRTELEAALASRAVARVDDEMRAAVRRGDAAATYLRLSLPTSEDRAVALIVLGALRTQQALSDEVDAAIDRWETMIAREVGDSVRAEVIRLVADGLFVESLVGPPPPAERIETLIRHLVGPDNPKVWV